MEFEKLPPEFENAVNEVWEIVCQHLEAHGVPATFMPAIFVVFAATAQVELERQNKIPFGDAGPYRRALHQCLDVNIATRVKLQQATKN